MKTSQPFSQKINQCLLRDRYRLRAKLKKIKQAQNNREIYQKLEKNLQQQINHSLATVQQRQLLKPPISYNEQLPVSQSINDIKDLFEKNQILIVASETGSGKTTQLPKMCLAMGRGIYGQIAHTQPRRLATLSVAARISEELNCELGKQVGFKVRFTHNSSDESLVKLMTDGILLAEIHSDRYLNQYDTIIIDEAHERSLNIDLLMGYIKSILPQRPDLKVIITSATINTDKFSRFFNQAPVIEVSGKTWPVEIRYHHDYEDVPEFNEQLVIAIDELIGEGSGDILIFMSGEREIRESLKYLKAYYEAKLELLPLFARLTAKEQQRIFQSSARRKIILSTNIAETSITVPGIRFVIDTGYARISRYSVRNKIQLLPVEKISQASAKQRSGRCGRVASGIAIRMYDEEDFLSRPAFTDAEILRTNLAQVILQTLKLKMGNLEKLDLLDSPASKQINDGYTLLLQLGAISERNNKFNETDYYLTATGHQLARFNVDPKLGRVILEAKQQGVLIEVIIIVAALSSQDPRDMPRDKQQAAKERHQRFVNKRSDFMTMLNIWCDFHEQEKNMSQRQLRAYCQEHFLSFKRIREWREIAAQLKQQLKEMKITIPAMKYSYEPQTNSKDQHAVDLYFSIHQSLLSGLNQYAAFKDEDKIYKGCRGLTLRIHPGSGLYKKQPKWILAAEIVETSQVYARMNAYIEPGWIEHQAAHLVKYQYYEPLWNNKTGRVMAKARLSLFGLIINHAKPVNYGEVDPQMAHEVFIKDALVCGQYRNYQQKPPDFINKNQALIDEVKKLEEKSRRHDILVDDQILIDFYLSRIKTTIFSRSGFENWYKKEKKTNPQCLLLKKSDIMLHDAAVITENLYPEQIKCGQYQFKLDYHFIPGHPLDGVNVIVPLALLNQLKACCFSRLVPGLIREKIDHLFRALPKKIRKELFPIADKITLFMQSEQYQQKDNDLYQAFTDFIQQQTQFMTELNFFSELQLPDHLEVNYILMDLDNQELDSSRDLAEIQNKWGKKAEKLFQNTSIQDLTSTSEWEKQQISQWDFSDLPQKVVSRQWDMDIDMFPALIDQQQCVDIQLLDTQTKAALNQQQGVLRLLQLQAKDKYKKLLLTPSIKQAMNQLGLLASMVGITNYQDDIFTAAVSKIAADDLLIYKQQDFQNLLEKVLHQLESALSEIVSLLNKILKQYSSSKKSLKKLNHLSALKMSQDIQKQLNKLFHPRFIAETPWPWLKRFPVYLDAIARRLEKSLDIHEVKQQELMKLEFDFSEYYKTIDWQQSGCFQHKNAIEELYWMIEEMRISLYAQDLKTIKTVSLQRLDKEFLRVQKKCPD